MSDEDAVILVTFDTKDGDVYEQFTSVDEAEAFVQEWQGFEPIENLMIYQAKPLKAK